MNEIPLFFSSHGNRLFGVLHHPQGDGRQQAFVFCHPFAEEKLWAHRVFVNFARELAIQGYGALRFDYRGYGDSEGGFSEFTVAHHLEDIESAIRHLRSSDIGATQIGVLGHRLGATLALRVAASGIAAGPVILWDPITDTERYIQEFLRSNLTTQLSVYGEIRETRERLIERMRAGELINVDGYDLSESAYEELMALGSTVRDIGTLANPALLVQVDRKTTPRKASEALAKATGARLSCVTEEPFWREIKRWYFRADNLFDVTLRWLEEDP